MTAAAVARPLCEISSTPKGRPRLFRPIAEACAYMLGAASVTGPRASEPSLRASGPQSANSSCQTNFLENVREVLHFGFWGANFCRFFAQFSRGSLHFGVWGADFCRFVGTCSRGFGAPTFAAFLHNFREVPSILEFGAPTFAAFLHNFRDALHFGAKFCKLLCKMFEILDKLFVRAGGDHLSFPGPNTGHVSCLLNMFFFGGEFHSAFQPVANGNPGE